MTSKTTVEESTALSVSEQSELLEVVRETLKTYLEAGRRPSLERFRLVQTGAAFVTLRRNSRLRGCIGHLQRDRPLVRTVSDCAIEAATKDPRFLPVTLEELPELEFEISVLSPFSEIHEVEEIEIGKHGLFISKGDRHGLLLPQVAIQLDLTPPEFLECLCRKAGLPSGAWKEHARIEVFQAQVFSSGAS